MKNYCTVNIGTESLHQTGVTIFSFDIKFCLRFVLTAGVTYNSLLHNDSGRYMEKSPCRYYLSENIFSPLVFAK